MFSKVRAKDSQVDQANSQSNPPPRKELFGFRRGVHEFFSGVFPKGEQGEGAANVHNVYHSAQGDEEAASSESEGLSRTSKMSVLPELTNDSSQIDIPALSDESDKPKDGKLEKMEDEAAGEESDFGFIYLSSGAEEEVEAPVKETKKPTELFGFRSGVRELFSRVMQREPSVSGPSLIISSPLPRDKDSKNERREDDVGQIQGHMPEIAILDPESRKKLVESRDGLFKRLPCHTIIEETIVNGFHLLRAQLDQKGVWRENGDMNVKIENVAQIQRGSSPNFNNSAEATDTLKVLMGVVPSPSVSTPYFVHRLNFEQFNGLTEMLAKPENELSMDEKINLINTSLKAAFNEYPDKLVMFKAFLILLKETSEHAEVNLMTPLNLVICTLNMLLQCNFDREIPAKFDQTPLGQMQAVQMLVKLAKSTDLGIFLIENADSILADI